MLHYYCPHCWKEIEAGAIQCPHCLYALADHERLSYEEKLLRALRHPIRENRMLAIQLLGELRSASALPAFEALLRDEEDPYVVREVARAVARIGGDEGRAMLHRLKAHRATIVRNAVEVFLGESAGAGPQDHPSVESSRSLDQGGGERVPAGP